MRRFSLLATALLLLVMVAPGHGDDKKPSVMKRKLAHAQKLLEGIAVNDLDTVAKNAEDLIKASQEAGWYILRTPKYELYSNDFRRSAETLIKNAKAKNVDGAALAYVELTLTCVKCHQHVREEKMASLPTPASAGR